MSVGEDTAELLGKEAKKSTDSSFHFHLGSSDDESLEMSEKAVFDAIDRSRSLEKNVDQEAPAGSNHALTGLNALSESDNDVSYKLEAEMIAKQLEESQKQVRMLKQKLVEMERIHEQQYIRMKRKYKKELTVQAQKQLQIQLEEQLKRVYIECEAEAEKRAEERAEERAKVRWAAKIEELEKTVETEQNVRKMLVDACDKFLVQRGF